MSEDNDRAIRNEILKTKQFVENLNQGTPQNNFPVPGVQGNGSASSMPIDIEIPAEDVPLPSKGLIYPPGSPLHNRATIPVRGIITADEDILMNQAYMRRGPNVTINKLLEACILDKNINISEFTLGDKNAILVVVRALGYGDYDVKVKCSKCDFESEQSIPLNLPIKELDLEQLKQVSEFTNEFEFQLPMSKRRITFKFPTSGDEDMLIETTENLKKRGVSVETPATNKLLTYVLSIEGNRDRRFIQKYIKNMPAKDSLALSRYMDQHDPRVEMKFDFSCQNAQCGHKEVKDIPLGLGFLWPSLV